ncbi:MAG: tyrosine--tRNA ligase [SAR324 cluster bacterium]|nr:tyrosine--tRNA ligase [SAR324 cluster bacterium]
MSVWDVLRERGLHQQCTDEAALRERSAGGPVTGYIGFDPTADSFHVGHLIPLMALVHFQRSGQRPIALVGGGTALIGDPTGKNEMRQMLDEEALERNIAGLEAQLRRLLEFEGPQAAIMANNAEWLREWRYIDFLREIGVHFSVSRMLTFETFRTRMETGLSFLEFNYPLLQSYDFLELHRRHGCLVQMGGDDQWANVVSGVDLVRRVERSQVFGWTFPLLTTASGAKMGKTERGAVWLDPAKTSPYDYYQYWVNIDDADVAMCLGLFTLLPMEQVAELSAAEGAELRKSKAVLAYEATRLIHGEEEAKRAEAGARALFGGGGDLEQVPTSTLSLERLQSGLPLPDALNEFGLTQSKSEGRRLIRQGGVSVNGERVEDPMLRLTPDHAVDGAILLRLGKKRYHRVVVEGGN